MPLPGLAAGGACRASGNKKAVVTKNCIAVQDQDLAYDSASAAGVSMLPQCGSR